MMCPENYLLSWLYVFGNVVFTLAIGMFGGWMISRFIRFVVAERSQYEPSPYLKVFSTFFSSPAMTMEFFKMGQKWLYPQEDTETTKLKTRIAELEKQLKEKDEPLRKLFAFVTPALAEMLSSKLGMGLPEATKMLEETLKPELIERIMSPEFQSMYKNILDTFVKDFSEPLEVPNINGIFGSRRRAPQGAPDFEGILSRKNTEIPDVIKTVLTKIIDDSIGASSLKERIELKSKLMGIIEGFEHVNKLIVSEPREINIVLDKILDNTLVTAMAEMKNDPVLKQKWDEFKIFHDKSFCVKDLPVGAIYNAMKCLKANLVK